MKILGLSPSRIFSGFETSFFDALAAYDQTIKHIEVELPIFKIYCTAKSFYPGKKKWALKRDLQYHTSISAFKRKSAFARKKIRQYRSGVDIIYQIGSLWDPTEEGINLPFFLQVDYTSLLSKKRNSEWKRKPGKEEEFWIGKEIDLYNKAVKVLTTTENARQSIINDYGVRPEKVVTVGAGVGAPYDKLEPDRFPDYTAKKILFIGKGFKGKGLDTLLSAFSQAKTAVPDAQLTIIGPTNLNIQGEGLNYLGRITDKNRVKEFYYQHSLFAMPSRNEPVGQVFLEAMSCKLPCIGTTVDAMPELIDDGKTGFIIEPGDTGTLAEYLIRILENPGLANELGKSGFEKLRSNHTWPVVGKRIYEIFRSYSPGLQP